MDPSPDTGEGFVPLVADRGIRGIVGRAERRRPACRRWRAGRGSAVSALLVAGLVAGCGAPDPEHQGIELTPLDGAATTASATPGTEPAMPGSSSSWGPSTMGVVTYVVDGDTVDVEGLGRVRVIGIDTPERGECGYESASAALSAMVLDQQVVAVPGESTDTDWYGRKLRFLDVVDDSGRPVTDAGLRLIEDGWAIARYDSLDGYPRHDRQDEYRAADSGSEDLGCYPDNEP